MKMCHFSGTTHTIEQYGSTCVYRDGPGVASIIGNLDDHFQLAVYGTSNKMNAYT